MSRLRISMFGSVRIEHDGLSNRVRVTRTIQALLGYLLLQRHRSHPREVLAGLFWGEQSEDRARSCLSTALWRLRRVLEPGEIEQGRYLVTATPGEVGFNYESDYWLDVAVFEERVGRVLKRSTNGIEDRDAEELERASQLYTGQLLEGLYDDWVLPERERLRSLHLSGLARLMRYHGDHGHYEQGLSCGQEILQHDPLREEIHREIMRLYLDMGQRALAVRQYEICRDVLATELSIPPMEETQALHGQIVQSPYPRLERQVGAVGEKTAAPQAIHQLGLALRGLDEARAQLHRAFQLVERSVRPQGSQRANVE